MTDENKYFGETFYHEDTPGGRAKAKEYLNLWRENLIRKLNRDSFSCEVVDEQWIERDSNIVSALCQWASLGLKIKIKANWNYELK